MLSLVELFCGCGGLTLGSKMAGFNTRVAIDIDPVLTSTFTLNFPSTRLVHADIATLGLEETRALIPSEIDGVVGGPPCQAFSEIGRRDARDPRRSLIRDFFRVVSIVSPKFFLMENVRGLGFSTNRALLDEALGALTSEWAILGPILLDASTFGAPTKRVRLFVFGFNRAKTSTPTLDWIVGSKCPMNTVHSAIADLQNAQPSISSSSGLDEWAYAPGMNISPYAKRMRSSTGYFTGHDLTAHRPATQQRFALVRPGETDPIGKHHRLRWDGLCPTLRAGTGNDRGSFQSVRPLHPSEDRVITVREAARLQGFPDSFQFHRTKWHSFRMIGNSVSPIIANALLSKIGECLA